MQKQHVFLLWGLELRIGPSDELRRFGGALFSLWITTENWTEFEFHFEVKLVLKILSVGIVAMWNAYAISTTGETKYYYHCGSIL